MEQPVARSIIEVRAKRVLLDRDLAAVYGVATRALNQAVKRNAGRFPGDFAFRLNRDEVGALERSRSQSVILKRGRNVKYLPMAFTEHGAVMAASLLNSPRAVEMSVYVVRAFVRLREFASSHARLAAGLAVLERKVAGHDRELEGVIAALRLLLQPAEKSRRPIGFRAQRGSAGTASERSRSGT